MAKSARASCRKNARSKIRTTLYAPAEEARINRLSKKLLALAASNRPAIAPSAMEIDQDANKQLGACADEKKGHEDTMDIDKKPESNSQSRGKHGKFKRKYSKSKLSVVFPGIRKSRKATKKRP